jgi:membrane-bound ClpP family serine protease
MSEPIVQFLLRVPESVKRKIEESAKENNRSTNAEALVRLEKSFEDEEVNKKDVLEIITKLFDNYRQETDRKISSIAEIMKNSQDKDNSK